MPQIPLVAPPIPQNTPQSVVRADPGMFGGVAAAGARLGAGIADIGDLGFRIKNATDTAYVIGAQTKLEAASQDFANWTKTKPDTSTWQGEFDARLANAREDAEKGAAALSPMAKLHLKTATDAWQVRSMTEFKHLATSQNINNAQGTLNDAVNQGISVGDVDGAHGAIDAGVSAGIIHPAAGVALKKKVMIGVATNQANAAMEGDPFTFRERITEKDAGGNYIDFHGLPQPQRDTMIFRANKLANETRAQTVSDWATQVRAAQNGVGEMPDESGVRAKAAHQGIAPKTIDALFKAPKPEFDADEYAKQRNDLMALDLVNDPDSSKHAQAMEIVESQKSATAHEELKALMDKKGQPGHPLNSPVAKGGDALIAERYKLLEKQATTSAYVPPKGLGGEPGAVPGHFKATTNQAVIDKAQATRAQVQTKFNDFIEKNPAAKPDEVQKFINDAFSDGGGDGESVFGGKPVNPQTGNVPYGTSTAPAAKPVTPAQAAVLPAGTRYLGTDGIWRTR